MWKQPSGYSRRRGIIRDQGSDIDHIVLVNWYIMGTFSRRDWIIEIEERW